MLAFILASITNFAFANNADTETKTTTNKEVISMDHNMFIENVFDYLKEKEWKFKGNKPIIIDFYADWCGPCRKIAPIMKELAEEYAEKVVIYKVDTDKETQLAGAMGIRSLPTVLFIPLEGKPQVIMGAADKATFQRAVKEVLLKE